MTLTRYYKIQKMLSYLNIKVNTVIIYLISSVSGFLIIISIIPVVLIYFIWPSFLVYTHCCPK